MDTMIGRLFFHNWSKKSVALLAAVVLWFFLNQSITTIRTIQQVPIRVVHLPATKTIAGLLPDGIFHKTIPLTLSGTRDVMESLEPGDFEVLLDASVSPHEWVVKITSKNLVSLNPNINLIRHVTQVTHPELTIKIQDETSSTP